MKLKQKLMVYIWIIATLSCIFTVLPSSASDHVSLFDPNNISVLQDNISILEGTWIGNSNQEALAVIESSPDGELHLGILQESTEDSYSVVSMSSGFLSPDDYSNNPHQLLDHMKDGHPYFDMTTDEQWMYIEFEKNDSGEWLVSNLVLENRESGERLSCNCDVDALSVWVFSTAYPRINWPFLHDELTLDRFSLSSFASECKRALAYMEEVKDQKRDSQTLEIEW